MRVTVLGAGSWGTTLALVLAQNGHEVTLWTYQEEQVRQILETGENPDFLPGVRIPKEIGITSDIRQASDRRDMIVAAVPSQFLRPVIKSIAELNLKNTIICNVAKGIENDSLMTMSEVLLDVLQYERKENIAILSGPSHAEEVSRQIPTAIVSSSFKEKTARIVQSAFMTPWFRVYINNDIRGVELGGALKNVIAVACGISDGAKYGDNTKAAIMTRGIYEMTGLGLKMGAKASTFAGLSGIGDLIVTCTSRHSRNRFVGERVGSGKTLETVLKEMVMVAEGVPTTKSVMALRDKYDLDMPIVTEVYKILFDNKNPHQGIEDLMRRHSRED